MKHCIELFIQWNVILLGSVIKSCLLSQMYFISLLLHCNLVIVRKTKCWWHRKLSDFDVYMLWVLENIQPNQHLKTCYSFGLAIAVACILVWPMQIDQTQQDKTCHSYPSHLLTRICLGSNLLEQNLPWEQFTGRKSNISVHPAAAGCQGLLALQFWKQSAWIIFTDI